MTISIITVTYNAVDKLEKTLSSVLAQTRKPDELIVVDGGSQDGTVQIIKQFETQLTKWVSEPDRGIYHAMNKAVSMVSGDWVLFMNADDMFVTNDVLEKTIPYLEKGEPGDWLAYGDCQMVLPDGTVRDDHALPPGRIYQRMICSHQSLFARREALLRYPFDEQYRVCADHHFVLNLVHAGFGVVRLPFAVARVQLEHYTWKQIRKGHGEKWRAVRRVKKSFKIDLYFLLRYVRLALGSLWKVLKGKKS